MRVAYTSDLHVDISKSNRELVPHLVERVREMAPDVFVLAGDVANSLAALDTTLHAFSSLECLKVMVPGNHDVWIESMRSVRKGRDSFHKYHVAIPDVRQHNGFICPIRSPHIVDDVAIVGSIGWYDYSLSDPRLATRYQARDYDRGAFEDGIWNDTRFAVWLAMPESPSWRVRALRLPNHEVFARLLGELQTNVDQIPADVDRVLVGLHTAPFRECLTPKAEPSPFDAYEGSAAIGEYLESLSAEKRIAVVIGHRHKPLYLERGNVRVYRSPVGYLSREDTDYAEIAARCVGEFDV